MTALKKELKFQISYCNLADRMMKNYEDEKPIKNKK